jgi:hypothetical protein
MNDNCALPRAILTFKLLKTEASSTVIISTPTGSDKKGCFNGYEAVFDSGISL